MSQKKNPSTPKATTTVATPKKQKTVKELAEKIANNEIKRLTHIAGVLIVRKDVKDITRHLITSELVKILTKSVIIAKYAQRKTLQYDDIVASLQILGVNIILPESLKGMIKKSHKKETTVGVKKTKKDHRFKPGTVSRREIVRLQKKSDRAALRKLPFQTLARAVVNSLGGGEIERIQGSAFEALQFYIESILIKYYRMADEISIYMGRKSLFGSDLALVYKIETGINISSA